MEAYVSKSKLTEEVYLSMYNNPHKDGKNRMNHRNEHMHFVHMIYHMPNADVRHVVHSRFVDGACLNCGWFGNCVETPYYKYCPGCGATMDLESEGTDE